MKFFRPGGLLLAAGMVLWVVALAYGSRALLNYESAPGRPAQAPPRWPADSALAKPRGQFALVMLAHAECPCTQASLSELAVLLARAGGRIAASVVFVPFGREAIENSSNWRRAQPIPGVSLSIDRTGEETQRFHGWVSGQTLLYSPTGELLFSGGITASRGHEGASLGRDAILAHVTGIGERRSSASVFGCSLVNPERVWQ